MFLQDLWERRSRGRLDYKESSNLVASLPGVNWSGSPNYTPGLCPLFCQLWTMDVLGAIAILSSVIPTSMPVKKDVPYVCSYENDVLVA